MSIKQICGALVFGCMCAAFAVESAANVPPPKEFKNDVYRVKFEGECNEPSGLMFLYFNKQIFRTAYILDIPLLNQAGKWVSARTSMDKTYTLSVSENKVGILRYERDFPLRNDPNTSVGKVIFNAELEPNQVKVRIEAVPSEKDKWNLGKTRAYLFSTPILAVNMRQLFNYTLETVDFKDNKNINLFGPPEKFDEKTWNGMARELKEIVFAGEKEIIRITAGKNCMFILNRYAKAFEISAVCTNPMRGMGPGAYPWNEPFVFEYTIALENI